MLMLTWERGTMSVQSQDQVGETAASRQGAAKEGSRQACVEEIGHMHTLERCRVCRATACALAPVVRGARDEQGCRVGFRVPPDDACWEWSAHVAPAGALEYAHRCHGLMAMSLDDDIVSFFWAVALAAEQSSRDRRSSPFSGSHLPCAQCRRRSRHSATCVPGLEHRSRG